MDNLTQVSNLILSMKDNTEIQCLLNELLSDTEIEALSKRWQILTLLAQGKSQREIAKMLNVSLCKITRGSKILKNKDSITAKFLMKENNNEYVRKN